MSTKETKRFNLTQLNNTIRRAGLVAEADDTKKEFILLVKKIRSRVIVKRYTHKREEYPGRKDYGYYEAMEAELMSEFGIKPTTSKAGRKPGITNAQVRERKAALKDDSPDHSEMELFILYGKWV